MPQVFVGDQEGRGIVGQTVTARVYSQESLMLDHPLLVAASNRNRLLEGSPEHQVIMPLLKPSLQASSVEAVTDDKGVAHFSGMSVWQLALGIPARYLPASYLPCSKLIHKHMCCEVARIDELTIGGFGSWQWGCPGRYSLSSNAEGSAPMPWTFCFTPE